MAAMLWSHEQINLAKWLHHNGFSCDALDFGYFVNTGRGLKAKRDIRKGELMLSVPEKLLLNTRSARRCSILGPLLERIELNPVQIMCIHLLVEKRKMAASFWKAYLDSLPQTYDCALFFSKDETMALCDKKCQDEVEEMQASVNELYCKMMEEIKYCDELELNGITKDEFYWAWSVVMTRGMYFDENPKIKDIATLVPFADHFNHANVPTNARFEEDRDEYRFYADCDWKKGEEVFICYGTFHNWQLLRDYGFMLPWNGVDAVPIPLTAPEFTVQESSAIAQRKSSLMRDNCIDKNWEIGENGTVSWSMMAGLRVRCATGPEVHHMSEALLGNVLSSRNEQQVWSKIIEFCTKFFKSRPTIEDDELALTTTELSYRKRMIIQRRLWVSKAITKLQEQAKQESKGNDK